jgi:hypothetical protein
MRTAATASYGGERGDKAALYLLVRLLRVRGEQTAAQQAVADIDAGDTYAIELANQDVRGARLEADERVLASRNGA